MNKKQVLQIIVLALLSCIFLYYLEQILQSTYIWKTTAKIVLFLLVPVLYTTFIIKIRLHTFLNIRHLDVKRLKLGFFFGICSACIILLSYYFLNSFIDTKLIVADLQNRLEITPQTYLFVALYITFGNSLLEEFYFRGFIFLQLYRANYRLLAYFFSATLFAVYHVAIFATWFNGWLTALALLGLFVVGNIFNWLNTKSNNFLNSWILHILADISIVLIGYFMLFQMS